MAYHVEARLIDIKTNATVAKDSGFSSQTLALAAQYSVLNLMDRIEVIKLQSFKGLEICINLGELLND